MQTHRQIEAALLRRAMFGAVLSGLGYCGLLAYDFRLGLRVGQPEAGLQAALTLTVIWGVAVLGLAWTKKIALASSIGLSWLLLVVVSDLPHDAYLTGLSRAASAPGFIEQLSKWAYATTIGDNEDLSLKADQLPTFLYDWLGKPEVKQVKQPRGYLRIINAFRARPQPPRSFEFGSIGFSFTYEPYGTRTKELRDGVYLYTR